MEGGDDDSTGSRSTAVEMVTDDDISSDSESGSSAAAMEDAGDDSSGSEGAEDEDDISYSIPPYASCFEELDVPVFSFIDDTRTHLHIDWYCFEQLLLEPESREVSFFYELLTSYGEDTGDYTTAVTVEPMVADDEDIADETYHRVYQRLGRALASLPDLDHLVIVHSSYIFGYLASMLEPVMGGGITTLEWKGQGLGLRLEDTREFEHIVQCLTGNTSITTVRTSIECTNSFMPYLVRLCLALRSLECIHFDEIDNDTREMIEEAYLDNDGATWLNRLWSIQSLREVSIKSFYIDSEHIAAVAFQSFSESKITRLTIHGDSYLGGPGCVPDISNNRHLDFFECSVMELDESLSDSLAFCRAIASSTISVFKLEWSSVHEGAYVSLARAICQSNVQYLEFVPDGCDTLQQEALFLQSLGEQLSERGNLKGLVIRELMVGEETRTAIKSLLQGICNCTEFVDLSLSELSFGDISDFDRTVGEGIVCCLRQCSKLQRLSLVLRHWSPLNSLASPRFLDAVRECKSLECIELGPADKWCPDFLGELQRLTKKRKDVREYRPRFHALTSNTSLTKGRTAALLGKALSSKALQNQPHLQYKCLTTVLCACL